MTTGLIPRRSVLYMPGSNARALEKARGLPADGLILDLEDAVAPEAKALARSQVRDSLAAGGYGGRELIVRVNGLDTPWAEQDLRELAGAGADALLFPKIDSADQVRAAERALNAAGVPASTPMWIMAETPRCILNIDAVAAASSRIQVIVMGTSDLGKDMRVRYTPDRRGMATALSLCVLAARAHGRDVLDGVHPDLANADGFERSCESGRDLGFDGKTLVHPSQIEAANRIFAPDEEALSGALRIIEAWERGKSQGQGIVVVDGRMVENLHVEEARRMVALAEAINALGGT